MQKNAFEEITACILQKAGYNRDTKKNPSKQRGKAVDRPSEGAKLSGKRDRAAEGLSGEAHSLSAEGARRLPNLSGKRTEIIRPDPFGERSFRGYLLPRCPYFLSFVRIPK